MLLGETLIMRIMTTLRIEFSGCFSTFLSHWALKFYLTTKKVPSAIARFLMKMLCNHSVKPQQLLNHAWYNELRTIISAKFSNLHGRNRARSTKARGFTAEVVKYFSA